MIQKYTVTKDADMLAPEWLINRINYKTVKFVYVLEDGTETLKGVRINADFAKIGDMICFDGKKIIGRKAVIQISPLRPGLRSYFYTINLVS